MAPRDDDQGAAILEAATRLLMAEGAGALTVRRIAAEAGCSTMGLYSRFGGKDGVVDRLYVQGFEFLCDAMSDLPKTEEPLADLRECARIYRVTALAHAAHYMIMFGRAVPGFQPSEGSHMVAHDAFERLVRRVQRCIDAGVFGGDAKQTAEMLWGSMHGLVMLELVGVNPLGDDPADRYERSLDALCDGLRVEHHGGAR
jgi:AcrR family transcriptional regulator